MADLSLVTTQELADELERRYEHFVFAAAVKDTNDEDLIEYWVAGNEFILMGLLFYLNFCLAQDVQDNGRPSTAPPG